MSRKDQYGTMANMPQNPTWRAIRLGQDLRRLRETARLATDEAAEAVGFDRSKVSRIENAKVTPTSADVAKLLDLYGVTSPTRDSLLQLAKDAAKRGWWTAYGDVFTGTYIDMEDSARRIRDWEVSYVPGLLQTSAYAAAVFRSTVFDISEEELEKRVRARMARKPLLERSNPPELHAIIDENVFRRVQGDATVMRGQLRALLEAPENVTVQVLPYSANWNAGMLGSFVVMEFDEDISSPKAHAETPGGEIYVEGVEGVRRCSLIFEALQQAALPPNESRAWISELEKEYQP